MGELKKDYPWIQTPLVVGAPMRLIALAPLAVEVSKAGGLGFIGAGSDISFLEKELNDAKSTLSSTPLSSDPDILPIGIGFLLWGCPLDPVLSILTNHIPAAIWLFAPRQPSDLTHWTREIRRVTGNKTKIWIQVGTVADAVFCVRECSPDVLVVQGQDAGGHGLERGAGLVPLLPEVVDSIAPLCREKGVPVPSVVATGGISDGRGLAASLALGAAGVVLGTRYLAAKEANIAGGYVKAVLRASDGGVNTIRSRVYDTLRGTTDWPVQYGGRGVINRSFLDAQEGVSDEENKKMYEEAVKRGDEGWAEDQGRLTTYAGAGVGLVKEVMSAGEITRSVREEGVGLLRKAAERWA